MTHVEERGLCLPCPLHVALSPPALHLFLEQLSGEFRTGSRGNGVCSPHLWYLCALAAW